MATLQDVQLSIDNKKNAVARSPELERALQKRIDSKKHYKYVYLSPEDMLTFGRTVRGEIIKEVKDSLPIIQGDKTLYKVKISTLAKTYRNFGDALGRYFEWCVYSYIRAYLEGKGADEEGFTPQPIPSFAFSLQQYAITQNLIFSANQAFQEAGKRVEEAAAKAGALACERFKIKTIQAVAGSDKAGDIKITTDAGDVILELKYYSDPTQIRWYSTSDNKLFNGTLLSNFSRQRGYWDTPNDGKPPLTKESWTRSIREQCFKEYIEEVRGNRSARDFFIYLLGKGESTDLNKLTPKHIIIGSTVGTKDEKTVNVEMTVNVNTLERLGATDWDFDPIKDKYYITESKEQMGYLTTNREEIISHARPELGGRKNAKERDYVPWEGKNKTSSIFFYLQKGYFGSK